MAQNATDAGSIALLQLKQHGIDVDPNTPLNTFTADLVYTLCIQAMRKLPLVFDEEELAPFPAAFPAAASSRFNTCGKLVNQLSAAGLNIEFNAVMYPTEQSAKTIVSWMASKLSASAEDSAQAVTNDDAADQHTGASGMSGLQRALLRMKETVDAAEACGAVAPRRAVKGQQKVSTEGIFARGVAQTRARHVPVRTAQVQLGEPSTEVIADTFTVIKKQPQHPKADRKPNAGLFSRDSILEVLGMLRTTDRNFADQCAQRLTTGDDAVVAPAAKKRVKSKRKNKGNNDQAAANAILAVDAMFQNTSDSVSLKERQRREADAEAAVESLEKDAAQAAVQKKSREEETEGIKERVNELKRIVKKRKGEVSALEEELEAARAQYAAEEAEIEARDAQLAKRMAALEEREATLALMDDPDSSLAQLRDEVEALKQKKADAKKDLANKLAKVEAKREELLEEARDAGAGKDETLAELRKEMKAAKKSIKERYAEIARLEKQLEMCPKDIDRSQFLRMIFDLTSNIRKQQEQVDKVQREINEANGDIDRVSEKIRMMFANIENIAFDTATGSSGKDKKTAPDAETFAKDTFKRLTELRKTYNDLVGVIESRGEVRREIHETEQHYGKLLLVVQGYNAGRVTEDLDAIKAENESLETQLAEA